MKNGSLKICLLIVALFGSISIVFASDLPKCSNTYRHNCFGTFTWENGYRYVGEWKDNRENGDGRYTWPNGNKYIGQFKNGNAHGKGVYTYGPKQERAGIIYVGDFKYGRANGQGKATALDGSTYEGEVKDSQRNGLGTFISAEGKVQHGIWKNDKFLYAKTLKTVSDGSCLTNVGICGNALLCQLAAPDVTNGKKAWFSSSSNYHKYVVEAKKRGLSCGVESTSPTITVETTMPKAAPTVETTMPKAAPVVSDTKPKKTVKPKGDLIDPLHLNRYGKTVHTPLLPNVIFFVGEIKDGDERGFRRALRNHNVDTIVLNSNGGSAFTGLELANIIYDNELATYVPLGHTCASACAFMYFGGSSKVAHGRLGVHQFFSKNGKEKAAVGQVIQDTQDGVAEIHRTLTDFGTPASVFSIMFSTSGMHYFTEEEKSEFSINGINPKLINRINQVLGLSQSLDDVVEDSVLNSIPADIQNRLTQLELVRIGCMKAPIDGIKGEATTAAIQKLSSKKASDISATNFSDLFRELNSTKVGACY